MGMLIREFEAQHTKRCDEDAPFLGCNQPRPITKTLSNVPSVFTVQLSWDVDVRPDDIVATMGAVHTTLRPAEVFSSGCCPHDIGTYSLHVRRECNTCT